MATAKEGLPITPAVVGGPEAAGYSMDESSF
jgi:hypothetical protein